MLVDIVPSLFSCHNLEKYYANKSTTVVSNEWVMSRSLKYQSVDQQRIIFPWSESILQVPFSALTLLVWKVISASNLHTPGPMWSKKTSWRWCDSHSLVWMWKKHHRPVRVTSFQRTLSIAAGRSSFFRVSCSRKFRRRGLSFTATDVNQQPAVLLSSPPGMRDAELESESPEPGF